MKLKDLDRTRHIMTGVDYILAVDDQPAGIRWRMGGTQYTVMENPSDGYRSSAEELVLDDGVPIVNEIPPHIVLCFHHTGSGSYTDDILEIVDSVTLKTIIEVGTHNVDDYYPTCVMNWNPEHLACNAALVSTNP